MRHSLQKGTLLLASVAAVSGCALPYESMHQHVAKFETTAQPATKVLPPPAMLHHPGPGVDGPGPGVFGVGPQVMFSGPPETSQIGFRGNDGMKVFWDVGGHGLFDSEGLVEPGRYNFPQGAIYRLKLTNIPGHPGVELYPTLELALATPRTEAFLAHNFIPFELMDEDFQQVLSGNFVTKVIYLPDPEHQEAVLAGAETLVSTRLEPGKDPIVEAEKRGSIMAIIRIGNKDLQAPGAEGGADVVQTSFHSPLGHGQGAPCGDGACGAGSLNGGYGVPAGIPPGYVAGVTSPLYGMPMVGTPIGLPGPPHIPLGVPAGLEEHVIANHTHMSIPDTVKKFKIDVKQEPGLSYPNPVHHVHIVESTPTPPVEYHQPCADHCQWAEGVPDNCDSCGAGACAPGP